MKHIITILTFVLMTTSVFAQSPEKMSYQAVVRDGSNNLVISSAVGMQISILQGSANGAAVYMETQTPTTNANGLISLEIGDGSIIAGDFTVIDWSNGLYFIKTEIDPTGGTSYTITGTSQLMSVPYALYAKTSGSSTPGPPGPQGNDGNGIASIVDNGDGTFTFTFDDATTFTTSDLTGPQGPAGPVTTYSVGDFAHGGVVFWVDETNQHGLVCTIVDVVPGTVSWYAGTYGRTRAVGDGIYGGESNTNLIISGQLALGDNGGNYAASVCSDLVVNQGGISYGDWYLPTVEELTLLGQNYIAVNATSTANGGTALTTSPYWSSVEFNNNEAMYVLITPGGVSSTFINKAATFNVRAVRRF